MILQTFVVVLLRLIAIKLGVEVVSMLAAVMVSMIARSPNWWVLAIVPLYLIASGVVWFAAPPVSRLICRGLPETVAPVHAGLIDLYSCVFVATGIYLIGVALGPFLNWMYYLLAHPNGHDEGINYYTIFQSFLQLFLGILLTAKARSFAARLARQQIQPGAE